MRGASHGSIQAGSWKACALSLVLFKEKGAGKLRVTEFKHRGQASGSTRRIDTKTKKGTAQLYPLFSQCY